MLDRCKEKLVSTTGDNQEDCIKTNPYEKNYYHYYEILEEEKERFDIYKYIMNTN
jgi:hypothetical protein